MICAGTVAVVYVLFAAASKPETTAGLQRYAVGEMQALAVMPEPPLMPVRTLSDDRGEAAHLADFGGEVLVVNLWATWCAPCVEEMPTLAALQRRFEGRLRVIPISVDSEGDLGRAQSMLSELSGGALPFFSDYTRGVLFDLRAAGMPVTVIYDADGVEVARLTGGADWDSEEAAALMEAVLSERTDS